MNTVKNIWARAGAATTAALVTMAPAIALAQPTAGTVGGGQGTSSKLGDVFEQIGKNLSSVPNVIAYVAYIAGAGFGISGIMALRAHVDNPAQAPLKNALIRLSAAAALVAFPWLISTMIGTLGASSGEQGIIVPTLKQSQ